MSSWDTNPWSNFCDPHRELICHNKWHPGTSGIFTTSKIAVRTHYLLMEKPLGRYFHVQSLYYQGAQCKRKHLFLYPQGDRLGLRKPKKGLASTLITTTTSVHLPKSASTDLTIKSDSILTNPTGKDDVRGWSM